ncbi:helicase associated domain-containing protein [Streptomyces sp. NBC_00846]|uniref:helicase associated domain-containing protein n=1 Tax=Streptomyces sp. NBC_00846 TaxID=2975849 RepID=UPI003866045A|nr:helicase associated domain-containing protein [Streptomyces sp. NBC_00846]
MCVVACFAAVREMLVNESALAYVAPGVTVHGMDVGRWLDRRRQHEVWQGLMDGHRERLEQLGVMLLPPEQEAPAKPSKGASGWWPWRRSTRARTGSVTAPRAHVERLVP